MPEYINKDYYRQLAPGDRSFINFTAQNVKAVMDRLNAEHIMYSATIGYKNTVTVSNADRDRTLAIVKSLAQQNRDNAKIIGNVQYRDLPAEDRRYINTDAETALQVANILAGATVTKFSGRINGDKATLTVAGDENASLVRRIIDNVQNMDLVNELNEKGYERLSDTNGFVNIRNTATGATAGFESLREVRSMFLDPENEFFHPTKTRIEENSFYRIVSDEPNMDYYISEYDIETGEEVAVYLDDEGKCPTFATAEAAVDYAQFHSIDYTNSDSQLEKWSVIDEERAAEKEMFEKNIAAQAEYPIVDRIYPDDLIHNPDNHSFIWVYFNVDGDEGNGEFIENTFYEEDVLKAYKEKASCENEAEGKKAFLDYIYTHSRENTIDAHSGYYEDYANGYINKPDYVNRFYDENSIIDFLEKHTPEIAKQKNYDKEITAEADGLIIDGYEGTWYVVDTETVDGKEIFLLESENYGDETFGIIIDKDRNVLVDESWNGFLDYHENYVERTSEEKLADKVRIEWTAFLDGMRKESADVLIESAYEISTKDNIQTYITEENLNLTDNQIDALLSKDHLIDMLYNEWNHYEYYSSYSDVEELLKHTADQILTAQGRSKPQLAKQQLETVLSEVRKALEENGYSGVESKIRNDNFDAFVNDYKEHFSNICLNGDYSELADMVFGSVDRIPDPWQHFENSVFHDDIAKNMEQLFDTMQIEWSGMMKAAEEKKQQEPPLFLEPVTDFSELSDKKIKAYHASNAANMECSRSIEAAIGRNYDTKSEHSLDTATAIKEVLEKFSAERVAFILAARFKELDWDKRISTDNISWAKDYLKNIPSQYYEKKSFLPHENGLADLFGTAFRREYLQEKEKKTPERTVEDITIGDRYRFKGADVEVVSMKGVYPNDVGISKTENMGGVAYAVTSNVDKYELHRNGEYLGNGEKTVVSELDKAKKYISDYLEDEFASKADFTDMQHIHIGYTEIGSEEQGDFELQMEADLENLTVSYLIDGEIAAVEKYDSPEQMNRENLSVLSFEDMVSVGTAALDKMLAERQEKVSTVLAVSQYDTSRYYIANDVTEAAVKDLISNSDKLFMNLCALGGKQISEIEFAQYSQTDGIKAIDVNIDEQTMHIYNSDSIISFGEIRGVDNIFKDLDLANNTMNFSVITIDGEEPFVTGEYVRKDDVTELEEYQEYIEKTGKASVDVRVEYYQLGGDNESYEADENECAYISEHLAEVLDYGLTICLEMNSYSIETPMELLEAEVREENELDISWIPISETEDENGHPTSYYAKYNDETFWISENPESKFDIEEQDSHGNFVPINEDFSGFMRRGEAEKYFEEHIGEYIAERDEAILDALVGNTYNPESISDERDAIAAKNNVLNDYFNNNPKAVMKALLENMTAKISADMSISETQEIFGTRSRHSISLNDYDYSLTLSPIDSGLNFKDDASGREMTLGWGHVNEIMRTVAHDRNAEREDLIHSEILYGTGFHDGKFRVEDYYEAGHRGKEFATFLKKEYGIGGHSGIAPIKWSNHDSRGLEIETEDRKETYTWNEVAKAISELMEKGEYITQKDIDKRIRYAQWTIENANDKTDFNDLIYAHSVLQKYDVEQPQEANEYKIYQLKKGEENHLIRFAGYDEAMKYGAERTAMPDSYELIYTGSLDEFDDENKLEAIYTKFNIDRPADFKGHSLSVSDIIVMNDEASYVDSFGFVDVSDKFLGKEREKIDLADFDNIRITYKREWNDNDLNDEQNPAYEETITVFSMNEDNTFDRHSFNATNSPTVPIISEERIVSAEDMLNELNRQLEFIRSRGDKYTISLTDSDGNVRDLKGHEFEFVVSETSENIRTDFGYEPSIGDVVDVDGELHRITDINDNVVTMEEVSNFLAVPISMTMAEFLSSGYLLYEQAKESERIKSPVETERNVSKSPVETKEKNPVENVKSPPETKKSNANNFVITNENLGVNGPKARFNANVAAVQTLNKIESENRTATPEEQVVLSEYTGWGAIPQAFDPNNSDWKAEYEKLKTVLSDSEYIDARRSTLNSHYTSPIVINAIYEGISNFGFEKGKILEPAMGIGNFFGSMPEKMRGSELHGVELDDLTGRIAKQLYPSADIQIKGFEKTAFENDSFDVVVGNVPFGNYKVNDKDYNKNNFLIHDYFIAKALDKVHAGGVVAVVTSNGTMDKKNDDIRNYIAQRAELLGAIRLPDTAFKANAGTEVVSDILFLKKRERPIEIDPDKEDWIKIGTSADGFDVNNYFAENHDMVMGEFREVSGRFGNEVTVRLDDPSMLKNMLFDAVKKIHGEYEAAKVVDKSSHDNPDIIPAPADSRKFSYQAVNGELYYREAGETMEKVPQKGRGKDKLARAVAMVELRDTVRELLDLQMNNSDKSLDDSISEVRGKLNRIYDAFVQKYGYISEKKNKDAFKGDDDYQLLSALETEDKENGTYKKADIFEHNTVKPKTIAEHVETAQEALIISIAEKAKVDFDFMFELCGMDKESMIKDLQGQIFRLPIEEEKYVTADEYLTGNIRKKIAELDNAPEGMDITANREALEKAIPPRVEAKDISVKLGSHWISSDYIRQFICEKFNPDWKAQHEMTVQYSKAAGEWKIEDVNAASKKNYVATNVFGTHRMHAYKILEGILNNSDLQVKDHKKDENGYDLRDDKGNYILVVNQEETKAVRQVANLIKSEFQDWIFKDPDRREDLVQTYNEIYNSIRPREYDGSHLNFVGMNTDITLKEHQKNAIARALYGGNTLLAHAVGAGKSYEMIAIAMEGKRLGLHTKSLFAVPNSLTEQMGNDFRKLYPNANVLVATKKDFEKANRLKLFAKIAANDWDAVIVGHTQFDRMGLSPEREQAYLKAEIEKLREEMENAAAYGEKSFSVKKIEAAIANYEDRLQKLNDAQVKDDFIDFEKLGFDKIFIDECHMYKNLATATKMHNVSGLGSGGAARSFNLLMKSKYMDEITGGKGQTYASGTPISNSMCELYTMMRYLQAGMLKDCGIDHFDEWAADFGEVKTDYELKPESDGKYQLKTRFAKFTNLPELMGMFKECADIRTADTLDLEKPESHYHEVVAEPSKVQKRLIKSLSKRATAIRDGKVDPREDNMLVITNDGRKIGLDQRLIDSTFPDEEGSKVNLCVNNVYDIYQKNSDKKSTQCIFCDMSTPKADSRQDRFEVYRPNVSKELGYELVRRKIGLGNGDEDNPRNINTFADVKGYIDRHSPEQSDKLSEGDIVVIRRPDIGEGKVYSQAAIFESGKLNDLNSVELLERLAMSDIEDMPPKEFNVYDDIKNKLMEKGVPEKQIAFIHDYDTAEKKQKLFDMMNNGDVRILIGSTAKCGAGMNAQRKMIALHHLDCPLRPSDMQQRDGRIERQGNENPEVDIFRYVTNKSFDSYLFQILENKQKFISQVMTSKTPERTCADMDETALDYAEVKALCAGNPLIKREMELQTLIKDLKMEKARYSEHIYELQDNIRVKIPEKLHLNELVIEHLQKDVQTAGRTPKCVDDEGKEYYPITIMGTVYNDRKDAGTKLKSLISANAGRMAEGKTMDIGEYRGFKLSIFYDTLTKHVKACLDGEKHHYCDMNPETDTGNLVRLDNCINNIQKSIDDLMEKNETMRSELEQMKADVDKPFSKADELLKAESEIEEVHLQLTQFEMTDDTMQKEVFDRLADMFPQVMGGDVEYIKLVSDSYEDVHVEMNENILTICQTYVQNGDLMYDPRIDLRVDYDNNKVIPLSYENSSVGAYQEFCPDNLTPEMAKNMNDVLEFMRIDCQVKCNKIREKIF